MLNETKKTLSRIVQFYGRTNENKYPWLLILHHSNICHHEKKGPQMCGANFRQYRYKP